MKIEDSLRRLKEIVDALNSSELSLDESLKLFEEGSKISAQCYDYLKKAEQRVTEITDNVKTFDE
ncbi:MAG: exodeoxyribonuclease VII small subunit [Ruminococcaceae bacterium]|nr:exodeoxyribonuclease VII small subunit [Oscillospiraceae bacterium]